jgi:predicted TIM-barrel fold metal-dependent hydrolase
LVSYLEGSRTASDNSTAEYAIVDGHAHLGPREIGDEYAAMGNVYSAEHLIQSLNSNGVRMATVFAMRRLDDYDEANQYIFLSAKKYPDRIIPFARYNPWLEGSARSFEKAIETGVVRGLKLHPGDDLFDPDDAMVHPFFELAEKARIPVVLHTGGSAKPTMVGLAADRFPQVNFVLLHLGDFHDHVFVTKKCENVFIETSQCLYLHRIARRVVDKVGAHKVIWGTDVPYHFQEIEKRKIELAGLKEDELRLIMGANILRLLSKK